MTNDNEPISWAATGGGPLIAIEERHLRHWLGIDPPTDGRVIDTAFRWDDDPDAPATDYDRACDVEDYAALLTVGQGYGLLLSYECMTAWWPGRDTCGGILARWQYANSQAEVRQYMSMVPELPLAEPAMEWIVTDRKIYLFDSAYSGEDVLGGLVDDAITFELCPGKYVVSTCIYQPDTSTSLLLHRIDPAIKPHGCSR